MAEPSPSFKANPRKPRIQLPRGACDTHFHVFGPRGRFPFAAERSYTPPADAPKETLFALHKHLGIERGVVVQSAVHQFDNSAAADLLAANRNYRGIALLPASTASAELKKLDAQGFRGVRFHYMGHLGKGDGDRCRARHGETPRRDRLAPADPYGRPAHRRARAVARALAGAGGDRPYGTRRCSRTASDSPEFSALLALLKHKHVWVKVSGSERISQPSAPWKDAAPSSASWSPSSAIARSGAPTGRIRTSTEVPDDGDLVDLSRKHRARRSRAPGLLVDNPRRLYGFAA